MSNILGMDAFFPEGAYYPDIQGIDGYQVFADVLKALQISGITPARAGQTDIDALGIEDLSGTLASAEIRERQLHFWRDIPKSPAYSMNVEWSRVDDLGEFGSTGFIAHTDAGVVTDPVFFRGHKEVKFVAVKGQVTLPTQLVRLVGFRGRGVNAMDTSEELKMLELLRHAERNLFFARDDLDPIQWGGVFQQIDAAATSANLCRLDLRGAPPDKDLLERLTQILANNSADPTHLYVANQHMRDLRQSLFPTVRIEEAGPPAGRIGSLFERFLVEEIGGDPSTFQIRRTQMLTRGVKGGLPLNVPTAASPNAPTAVVQTDFTGAAGAHTATVFEPGLAAGTYRYRVTAVGKGGRTVSTQINADVTATAGQKITLTLANQNDANVLYYELYRNQEGSAATSELKFLTRTTRDGATTTYEDRGGDIPGTGDMGCFMIAFDEIQFRQLLPVVKRILPQELMSNAYGILLFGTPVVQVPTHNIHLVNVGERTQGGVAGAA